MNDEMQQKAAATKKRVMSLLGLATKAGYVASGEFSTEKAVKEGKACVVIVAEDASENTKKMFRNMCTFYDVPIYIFGEKTDLGHAIGKEFRASLSINDQGMARSIEKYLNQESSK
ncbi:L7Ae/L30e/S12e/Gadd45 family ribosomal protein [Lachnoclostridium sp.]|uniref:L7Ae/L30e/S12e/Gadd45 family ribosomal protein n=1 Tax=Lachnoclostridium sp. TaxID=2028282 RepID=UPI002898EF2B|nr:ribosomal L7Ae/L30e/S12e/Gadd45 family protein [Lachnoclostridium sp.]